LLFNRFFATDEVSFLILKHRLLTTHLQRLQPPRPTAPLGIAPHLPILASTSPGRMAPMQRHHHCRPRRAKSMYVSWSAWGHWRTKKPGNNGPNGFGFAPGDDGPGGNGNWNNQQDPGNQRKRRRR
jgi:hypothetical protein